MQQDFTICNRSGTASLPVPVPPGLATMHGVFGYCGKPFDRIAGGRTERTYGWLDLKRHRFAAPVGPRLLGSCDVPDLALFPARYLGVQTVTFHAGFASAPGHLFLWAASQLVRFGIVRSLASLVVPLHAISQKLEPFISDKGAMFVRMDGIGSCLLDLGMGIGSLFYARSFIWWSQFVLVAAYTMVVSLFLPEFLLHPFGPITKNLSVLACLAFLALADKKKPAVWRA